MASLALQARGPQSLARQPSLIFTFFVQLLLPWYLLRVGASGVWPAASTRVVLNLSAYQVCVEFSSGTFRKGHYQVT